MRKLPKARSENVVMQSLTDEVLLYDLQTNKVYCLNETSAFIWNSCNGKKDVPEIARELAKLNKKPVNEEIVWLAIDQLEQENLMSEIDLPPVFVQTDRREMLKRIGLATMIALPLVTGLVAPRASEAASTSVCGTPCISINGCSDPCQSCFGSGICSSGNYSCRIIGFPCKGLPGICLQVDPMSTSGICSSDNQPCFDIGGPCISEDGICNGTGTCQ